MAIQQTFYTVQDAAEKLRVTEGRVRQILNKDAAERGLNIGRKLGSAWILDEDDIEKARTCIKKIKY